MFKLRADWSAAAAVTTKRRRNAVTLGKEGHKTNMDFPTIYKKFYYCLHQTTLYVKVILLKACFKYEKAYIKNRFFKDFTGRVHLHVSEQRHYETARKSRHSRELRQTVDDEATSRLQQWPDTPTQVAAIDSIAYF